MSFFSSENVNKIAYTISEGGYILRYYLIVKTRRKLALFLSLQSMTRITRVNVTVILSSFSR